MRRFVRGECGRRSDRPQGYAHPVRRRHRL